MDRRTFLEEQMREDERHVAQGRQHVWAQSELVAKLQRDGFDPTDAKRLLQQFEELLELHVSHLETLRDQLRNL